MVINNKFVSNIHSNVNKTNGNLAVPLVQKPVQNQGEFGKILQQQVEKNTGLKFSKHAETRMQTRNILLSQAQRDKIGQAVNKAEEKGVKDSLVLMDNMAFVINVKSRTVITAVNSSELKENVFTNIDGAVFA